MWNGPLDGFGVEVYLSPASSSEAFALIFFSSDLSLLRSNAGFSIQLSFHFHCMPLQRVSFHFDCMPTMSARCVDFT